VVHIRVKSIIHENFQDYKKSSMFISAISCDWKCLKEKDLDISICHNSDVFNFETKSIDNLSIIDDYLNNKITSAIIFGGLEPMLQFEEIFEFIKTFREYSDDDIVIYTGYYPQEILPKVNAFKQFKNIIVKFGRYKPNKPNRYDKTLGITLSSDNQFAKKIS